MTFGIALETARLGHKITRQSWNGKNQFVYYQEGSIVNVKDLRVDAVRMWAEREKMDKIYIHGHLDMKNAQDELIIGWAATQTDMLADDWSVYD